MVFERDIILLPLFFDRNAVRSKSRPNFIRKSSLSFGKKPPPLLRFDRFFLFLRSFVYSVFLLVEASKSAMNSDRVRDAHHHPTSEKLAELTPPELESARGSMGENRVRGQFCCWQQCPKVNSRLGRV